MAININTDFKSCNTCNKTDGIIYTSNPPKCKCLITNKFHFLYYNCDYGGYEVIDINNFYKITSNGNWAYGIDTIKNSTTKLNNVNITTSGDHSDALRVDN